MKETELRIGNWVNETGDIVKVGKRTFKLWDEVELGDILKPIPLTKEWLVRLGWIKKNKVYYSADGESYMLFERGEGFQLVEYSEVGDGEWMIHHYIVYVHQLQNLYFALTGEELTL